MKNIELYVHTENGVDPHLIKVSEDATIKQLVGQIAALGGHAHGDDMKLFIEDLDEALESHRKLSECEIRHRHHVHCHRCHRVSVVVFYNGEKQEVFPPSAKVKRVLKWAINAFKLSPAEAADKLLVLKGNANEELPLDAHIGSYAKPGECSVDLCLVAPVEVQG
jgi:hypothetical protein